MGSTNMGNQTHIFDYYQEGTAKGFNKILYNILPTGIYEGFTLTRIDNTTVQVSTGSCYIKDSTNSLALKISTSTTYNITTIPTDGSKDLIVFRFDWSNTENNYMDMLNIATADLDSDDLIVGKLVHSGGTLQSQFDYASRDVATWDGNITSIIGDLDYDDLTNAGYYYHNGANTLTNNPASTNPVFIKVYNYNSGVLTIQEVFDLTNDVIYYRIYNSSWGSWVDMDLSEYIKKDGTVALTADWDAGSFKITAEQFESDIATGTAPLIVASTTAVTNLNADQVDGYDAGNGSGNIPISNGTVNTNLNADQVDGQDLDDLIAYMAIME